METEKLIQVMTAVVSTEKYVQVLFFLEQRAERKCNKEELYLFGNVFIHTTFAR